MFKEYDFYFCNYTFSNFSIGTSISKTFNCSGILHNEIIMRTFCNSNILLSSISKTNCTWEWNVEIRRGFLNRCWKVFEFSITWIFSRDPSTGNWPLWWSQSPCLCLQALSINTHRLYSYPSISFPASCFSFETFISSSTINTTL